MSSRSCSDSRVAGRRAMAFMAMRARMVLAYQPALTPRAFEGLAGVEELCWLRRLKEANWIKTA